MQEFFKVICIFFYFFTYFLRFFYFLTNASRKLFAVGTLLPFSAGG